MKANHNIIRANKLGFLTVSKSKITKKWKPITTCLCMLNLVGRLFQRAKLQKNESQSQLHVQLFIFNLTVSKSKITKKWKPITTPAVPLSKLTGLFQRAKLQKNESQSQLHVQLFIFNLTVSKSKITKKWKPITTRATGLTTQEVLFQRAKLQKNESQSQHPFFT